MEAHDFALVRHGEFFRAHMRKLPLPYRTMDTNRLTLLYFCVSALDLLGVLDDSDKREVVRYVYALQSPLPDNGGFYGYPRVEFDSEEADKCNNQPHIANTYVSLVMLVICGDDLRGVDREAIRKSLRKWQLDDGSFCCVHGFSKLDSENDVRFVYCAAAICYMLDLWDAIDIDLTYQFLVASQSYDGAFGMGYDSESHGGCTYCALAALAMMGRLDHLPGKETLIDWCTKRQHQGFQGRIEKPMDSCYSFWVGASLKVLGVEGLLHPESCSQFLKECETPTGGFQKFPEIPQPDLLHSYFSVCGLSLCGLLPPLDVLLGCAERSSKRAAVSFCVAPGSGGAAWAPEVRPRAPGATALNAGEAAPAATPRRPLAAKGWLAPLSIVAVVAAVVLALLLRLWQ